jgi:diphosphomevalonate decarboxylase
MKIKAQAPSNIALIKYMGKEAANIPANASLSYSLSHLLTSVELESIEDSSDRWELLQEGDYGVKLSEKGQKRFLDFFLFLKNQFSIEGNFVIRSTNNFPSDCGLASSASSFAALTKATYLLALELNLNAMKELGFTGDFSLDASFLSSYSRQGSGSSCRSLFDEWSVWEKDHAKAVTFPYTNLLHLAVIAEEEGKEVSSSEAHKRVRTSLLMKGRTERAETRLNALQVAFEEQNWTKAFELCWAEFWDMHALFESSEPSFGYMNSDSLKIISDVKKYWKNNNDGPLVTMDAGPNIHLLFRAEQMAEYKYMKELFERDYKVWGNH